MMNGPNVSIDTIRAVDHLQRGEPLDARDHAALGAMGMGATGGMHVKSAQSLHSEPFAQADVDAMEQSFRTVTNTQTPDAALTSAQHVIWKTLWNAPVHAMTILASMMLGTFRGLHAQNKTRDARLDALEAAVKEKRVTGVRWAGPYEAGKTYYAGELCQRSGRWICLVPETTAAPGSSPTVWRLVVHRKVSSDER